MPSPTTLAHPERVARKGLGPHNWAEVQALTERFDQPHRFVTLHAYEASFRSPYGHHNVFFRDRPGFLASAEEHTLTELWQRLVDGRALTIPHHTGKFPRPVDFGVHDARLRRNFEIYSAHGQSEAFDPQHALAFENSDFTAPSTSAETPSNAQDVWQAGLQLSTIAASDDHRARPGQSHWGLTAVRAPELTRESVFQALHDRRTYASTGARILLDLHIGGAAMGQVLAREAAERHTAGSGLAIEIDVVGTGPLEWVELLRFLPGDAGFRVLEHFDAGSFSAERHELHTRLHDRNAQPGAIYYVRVRQSDRVRNRVAMAWSSPIWLADR